MRTFTLRVEGIREAPEGKVSVDFTNRKPPKKPKKGKGGMCPPLACYDDMPSMNIYSLPMSKDEAKEYPVGALCKVTMTPTGEHAEEEPDEDDAPEKPSRKARLEAAAMKAAAEAE